ncbi:EAL and HDOD domain-containing protein [Pseudoduganella ginsengisoli]|uniref:HDOD domain-containing protein n=1 Tax=Pseudoduganella ginsengisoli TaxID=1462440 RepID=A0A6L6Q734_9BURK|nr:HDOD domain-containing protein [Pseudoduganella ginsengisoli]
MGLFSFLNNKAEDEDEGPAPQARAPIPTAAPTAAPSAAPAGTDTALSYADADAMLFREEIVDKKHRLCGYRFTFQAGGKRPKPTEYAFFEALEAIELKEFTTRRMAALRISAEGIDGRHHAGVVAPNTLFIIERRHPSFGPMELAARLAALKKDGCHTALAGASLSPEEAPLLQQADAVFLNLSECSLPQFQALLKQLRAAYPALKIVVENVNSWDEQRMCLAWGCDFCMGYFLTTPDKVDPDAKIDQSRLTSIELLNLLRTDAEVSELVDVAKQDPGLAFQVLKWANAPTTGNHAKITSLKEAIIVLGRSHLYRWLTVSMFRLGSNNARDEALLEVALQRARFLEIVANLPQAQRDELFLVGLLSLFDILLGMPMSAILDKMHLSDEVRDVLLRSDGPYGPYLMLALQVEKGQVGRAAEIALGQGIDPDTLGETSNAAFQWAQEALHHSMDG